MRPTHENGGIDGILMVANKRRKRKKNDGEVEYKEDIDGEIKSH